MVKVSVNMADNDAGGPGKQGIVDVRDSLREDMEALKEYIAARLTEQDKMLADLLMHKGKQELMLEAQTPGPSVQQAQSFEPSVMRMSSGRTTRTWESVRQANHQQAAEDFSRLSTAMSTEEGSNSLGFHARLRIMVNSSRFDTCILILVLLNIVVMAVQLQLETFTPKSQVPGSVEIVNTFFNFIFLIEVLTKWTANGVRHYFTSYDASWNMMDFVIVVLSMVEFVVTVAEQSQSEGETSLQQARLFRLLRVVRVGRGLRVMRAMQLLVPLRMLLLSIGSAMKALIWSVVLICFLLFGFAFIFAQVSVDFCREDAATLSQDFDNAVPECTGRVGDVKEHWGSLGESMLTLFMTLNGGVNWNKPFYALEKIHWGLTAVLLFYIALMYLAVLNVVTGIFCQNAIKSAAEDRDIAIVRMQALSRFHQETIEEMFAQIDDNGSGDISFDELKGSLDDPRMQAFFQAIDFDVGDKQSLWALFSLLDADKSGAIDAQEFVSGCINFKGSAKAWQSEQIKHDLKVTRELLKDLLSQVCYVNRAVGELQDVIGVLKIV